MESSETQVRQPGDVIRELLDEHGWTQADLARVIGRSISSTNEIIKGAQRISPEIALELAAAFGNDANFWMSLEVARQLADAEAPTSEVRRRAAVFRLAPISEMKKRGWLPPGDDVADIEKSLLLFFDMKSVDDEPQIYAVMRKGDAHIVELSPAQRAWCFRVLQLAQMIPASKFSPDQIEKCERALRKLAAYPAEVSKVGAVLAEHGIRFVIVEHLNGTKIDGATLWLDENSPVIGMTLRYDRIDNFWFTLFHELSHIRHRDQSVDCDITGSDELHVKLKPNYERRADEESAASIVDPKEMKSFILRVGPLYSKQKIIQFANRMKIHPGLIVGQLHARNEFRSGFRACREMLVKVRDFATSQALTDGWGQSVEFKDK